MRDYRIMIFMGFNFFIIVLFIQQREILWDNKLNFFFTFLFSTQHLVLLNISGYHVVTNGNFYFGLMTENYVTHFTKIDFYWIYYINLCFYKRIWVRLPVNKFYK